MEDLNRQIVLKYPGPKGLFQSGKPREFRVPPLNAQIASQYGTPIRPKPKGLFRSTTTTQIPTNFNWAATGSNTPGDPNKHRTKKLEKYRMLLPINQDCCGSCWAVSTSMAFADRYGIENDTKPPSPSIISIMSCCTKQQHKNVFKLVDTPDCDVNSSYTELSTTNNSMGMCSGGIPFSAGLSIFRNGLPTDENSKYTPDIFSCNSMPSFPKMNSGLIDKYPCGENIFETPLKMKMATEPSYISSLPKDTPPLEYVSKMKEELLNGPLVGGFLVLGDNLSLGMDSQGLGGGSGTFNWDSTGKVYVPGAYNQEWSVQVNSVGGSGVVSYGTQFPTQINDKPISPKAAIGEIFCGFHAIVIVGWGELDMEHVPNKNVKTTTGGDGREKLPFWICRNSWGPQWPMDNYYANGIPVENGTMKVPPGYWLHAMYPNMSMGLDIPVNYEGTYYGATMIMEPETRSSPQNTGSTPEPNECNTEWRDNEGYSCQQYGEFNWCTPQGGKGDGWDDQWGSFEDFKNQGATALDICCECGADGSYGLIGDPEFISYTASFINLGFFYTVLFIVIIFVTFSYMDKSKPRYE